jgi:hypothetical protein
MTGRWHGRVIDTLDARGLATFYQELLDLSEKNHAAGVARALMV